MRATMRWTSAAALCALGAMVLVACTGTSGGGSSSGGSGGAGAVSRNGAVDPAVGGTSGTAGGGTGGTAGGGAASGGARSPDANETGPSETVLAPQLVLTGSLAVVVRSVARSAARAGAIASAAGGRTDADAQDSPRGQRPSAQLTLRVPNPTVPSVLNRLAALGRETDRHLSTRDVTTEVADVSSRVASARAAIASLRTLYTQATKVGDVIRIESSLSQREASLESLQARQRSLSRQVALATITLDLTQRKAAAAPVAKTAQRSGFGGGLEHGWHAFTTVLTGLAVALGAALPFLLVLLVLGVAALVLRRRMRPRPVTGTGGE